MRRFLNKELIEFIDSGLMDYAYIESDKFDVDLSLGVNPLGFSKTILERFPKDVDFSGYPEVVSESLQDKISQVYSIPRGQLLVDAGVGPLLHLVLLTLLNPQDFVLMPKITFPAFEFLALLTKGKPVFINHTEDFDLDYSHLQKLLEEKPKVVVLCNPNNPTGIGLDTTKVVSLIESYSDTIFLIDEANVDFGGDSLLEYAISHKNVVVLRSFSKGFGLAGLRIGFAAGDKDLMYALKRRQSPFSVNVLAQKIGEIALNDMDFIKKSKEFCLEERLYLEKELDNLGYSFLPSDANYLLVDVSDKFTNSTAFIQAINDQGANAVDGANFRGLGGRFVRLSPRKREINEKFVQIVKAL